MIKLFVGIAIPSRISDRLVAIQNGIPGAAWLDKARLHMTLQFIGSVNGIKAEDARSTLNNIDNQTFSTRLEGVGFFGSPRKLRILWVGIQECEALLRLRASTQRWLLRAGLPVDNRKFVPHVTIGRLHNPSRARLRSFFESHSLFVTESFEVHCFHLYSSHQTRSGSVYKIEETYDLDSP